MNRTIEFDIIEIFRAIKKRYIIVVSITVVFMIAPVFMHIFRRKVYKTSFSFTSYFIQTRDKDDETKNMQISIRDIYNSIEQFNALYNYKKGYSSSEIPGSIAFDNLQVASTRTIYDEGSSINVELYLFNPKQADTISNALLGYLNNNSYYKKIQLLENERLIKLKKEYDEKIEEMEQMKKNLYMSNQNSTNIYNFNIFSDIAEMQKRSLNLEANLKIFKGFEYVSKPLIPSNPENGIIKYYALFLIIGLFFGSVIAIITHFVKTGLNKV